MDQFSVSLLGDFAVYHGDRHVTLPPASQRLVALVAMKRKPVHRLWVCAKLWPNVHIPKAVASLRSALWRLRPVGAAPLLLVDPQYLQLSEDVYVDFHHSVDLTEQLLDGDADAQLMADLLPLLRAGDLLDRWFEQWVISDRDHYHLKRKTALQLIADRCAAEPRTS
ncbi:AfsR/SARP family transcriptional regulator [Mycolicibacterium gadium]|uniref:Transcriptional regulator n=1 Tax=Mycolicibacterium gadium TaxID=1794 RepID=A0A7I7WV67_MYCGU|nr:transcriptional regulator [Mycolicibacterium gadium]BBZ21424.1 transcriptional regulator [Mycolicibacterium gadium]